MKKEITFKALTEKDLPLVFEWLGRVHVAEWWRESRDWELFSAKYRKKITSDYDFPYLVYIDSAPRGFVICAHLHNKTYGIDVFIADQNYLGKGYGYKMIMQFIEEIVIPLGPEVITIDPEITNIKAIACYEKVGFKKVKNIMTFDGQKEVLGILMELRIKS